jgi:hypothetical protein
VLVKCAVLVGSRSVQAGSGQRSRPLPVALGEVKVRSLCVGPKCCVVAGTEGEVLWWGSVDSTANCPTVGRPARVVELEQLGVTEFACGRWSLAQFC